MHSTACRNGREDYSAHFITEESIAVLGLLRSGVFIDFPKLKLIVSHGGGSVPYQVGRWVAESVHPLFSKNRPLQEHFTDSMKRLYYDCCIYHKDSIELHLEIFGTEFHRNRWPGAEHGVLDRRLKVNLERVAILIGFGISQHVAICAPGVHHPFGAHVPSGKALSPCGQRAFAGTRGARASARVE